MCLIAIGDIHGCLNELVRMWDQLEIDKNSDTIIFLGDYIDRGRKSKEVIDFIQSKMLDNYNIITLRGNHEDMYLTSIIDNCHPWDCKLPEKYLDFLENTKLYHITDDYLFVHAGVDPLKSLCEQTKSELLWIRDEFIYAKPEYIDKRIIFGHTPTHTILDHGTCLPYFDDFKIGIDTGCVYGGKLTAIKLPDNTIYQVQSYE